MDVPISISAFSRETLDKANIGAARDYLAMTPNVTFTDDGGSGSRSVNISIRGVSNVSLGEVSTANSIGYYIDQLNVGTVTNGTIKPQLQDIERIEILRGPQGTYFGRNALGGAINISTRLPNDELYSEISGSVGNYGTWGVEGIVNIPVNDTFMMRAVYAYDESDTWVENTVSSGGDLGYEYNTGRVAFRWQPGDALTFDLSVTYTKEEEGGDISVPTGVLDIDTQSIFGSDFVAIDEVGFYPDNDDKVAHDLKELNDNEFTIVNLRINYDFEKVRFTSVTGYIDSSTDRTFDQDNVSLDTIVRFNEYEGESFNQEFRLQSIGDGALDWTVGLFYADDEIEQFNSIRAGAVGAYTDPNTGEEIGLLPPISAGFRINENNRTFNTESIAIFGEAVWHIGDEWDLIVGGRYTEDDIDNESFDTVAFENAVPDSGGNDNFSDFSPRVVLAYRPRDNWNFWASVSDGYKAGGVDFQNEGFVSDFDAEELLAYELRLKTELYDNRLRLEGSIFYNDWADMQVQTNFLQDPTDISSAIELTQNAAEASAVGVELEMTALMAEGLQGILNMGYLDAEFDDFPNAVIQGSTAQIDLSNQILPRAPEWTASAILDYTFDIGTMESFIRAEWIYRDRAAGNLEAVASEAGHLDLPDFPYQIDSYDVWNLRLGLEGKQFRVAAFVENVLDEDYYTGTTDGFGLGGIRVKPHPRIYGLKLTWFAGS